MIGYPDRSYLWLMARKPVLSAAEYDKLIAKAVNAGYDKDKIQKVRICSSHIHDTLQASVHLSRCYMCTWQNFWTYPWVQRNTAGALLVDFSVQDVSLKCNKWKLYSDPLIHARSDRVPLLVGVLCGTSLRLDLNSTLSFEWRTVASCGFRAIVLRACPSYIVLRTHFLYIYLRRWT